MDKGIGFKRSILLSWLDATAGFCVEASDPSGLRAALEPVVGADIRSAENRRMAIDILLAIWLKTAEAIPVLRGEALARFEASVASAERVWLHYGLTLCAYPFFREAAAVIGGTLRQEGTFTSTRVRARLIASRGHLGSLDDAVGRVIYSLRDWGLLREGSRRNTYEAAPQPLDTQDASLERWLLASALRAHPAEELPFYDLLRLPELFPFRFATTVDDLRRDPRFVVQRQGGEWVAVRLT